MPIVIENYANVPQFSPIILVRRRDIFDRPDWVYELKYDGFRALARLDDGGCRIVSKKGNDLKRFDDLCSALPKEMKIRSAVLDARWSRSTKKPESRRSISS